MLSKPIPSSGKQLPVIGLGTLDAFDVDGTPKERAALVEVLQLLIEQVDYRAEEGQVALTFRPTGIRTLAAEASE